MLRLNAPRGRCLDRTYGTDNGANVSLAIYLYGDDAEKHAAVSRPKWGAWIDGTLTDLKRRALGCFREADA
jgi:hypothetical protein